MIPNKLERVITENFLLKPIIFVKPLNIAKKTSITDNNDSTVNVAAGNKSLKFRIVRKTNPWVVKYKVVQLKMTTYTFLSCKSGFEMSPINAQKSENIKDIININGVIIKVNNTKPTNHSLNS